MLSVGKLPGRAWQYFAASVAGSADDYYAGAGEAPGRWTGGGLAAVGLSAGEQVAVAQLDGLYARALHPESGERLGQPWRTDSVTAFDACLSAPKSVSASPSTSTGGSPLTTPARPSSPKPRWARWRRPPATGWRRGRRPSPAPTWPRRAAAALPAEAGLSAEQTTQRVEEAADRAAAGCMPLFAEPPAPAVARRASDGGAYTTRHSHGRYVTAEGLAAEQTVVDWAAAARGDQRQVDAATARAHAARRGLSSEQQQAVAHLTGGDALALLRAPAGAGKTTAGAGGMRARVVVAAGGHRHVRRRHRHRRGARRRPQHHRPGLAYRHKLAHALPGDLSSDASTPTPSLTCRVCSSRWEVAGKAYRPPVVKS